MRKRQENTMIVSPMLGAMIMSCFLVCALTFFHTIFKGTGLATAGGGAMAESESIALRCFTSADGSIALNWRCDRVEPGIGIKVVRRKIGEEMSPLRIQTIRLRKTGAAESFLEYIDAPSRPGLYTYEVIEVLRDRPERLLGKELLVVRVNDNG